VARRSRAAERGARARRSRGPAWPLRAHSAAGSIRTDARRAGHDDVALGEAAAGPGLLDDAEALVAADAREGRRAAAEARDGGDVERRKRRADHAHEHVARADGGRVERHALHLQHGRRVAVLVVAHLRRREAGGGGAAARWGQRALEAACAKLCSCCGHSPRERR
jgi:hypothetical protein